VAFWALTEIVKAHAGIRDTDPPSAVPTKLDAMIADLFPNAAEAAPRFTGSVLSFCSERRVAGRVPTVEVCPCPEA
jgi:hypothetical protein